jgi:hypothetical protein
MSVNPPTTAGLFYVHPRLEQSLKLEKAEASIALEIVKVDQDRTHFKSLLDHL